MNVNIIPTQRKPDAAVLAAAFATGQLVFLHCEVGQQFTFSEKPATLKNDCAFSEVEIENFVNAYPPGWGKLGS